MSTADLRSRFNSQIGRQRRQNASGVYNVHTNYMQYPRHMQPTRVRWERVDAEHPASLDAQANKTHDNLLPPKRSSTIFPPPPGHYAEKFLIADTYFRNPTSSAAVILSHEEAYLGTGPPTLSQVTDDVLVELPDACRHQVLEAIAQERGWQHEWSGENVASRATLKVTYNA